MNNNDNIVKNAIKEVANENNIKIDWNNTTKNFKEYGIDSLELMNLVFKVEKKLNVQINDEKLSNLKSLEELINELNILIK